MSSHFNLQRQIPIAPAVDVVVAGGGPAGSGAAIAAARCGAKVLLVEGTGAGGMGTNGLVANWYCLANNKEPVAGGLVPEFCQDMYDRGYIDPSRGPEYWNVHKRGFGFDAEGLKILLDEYCGDAHAEVRFETQVVDVDADADSGVIRGVYIMGRLQLCADQGGD